MYQFSVFQNDKNRNSFDDIIQILGFSSNLLSNQLPECEDSNIIKNHLAKVVMQDKSYQSAWAINAALAV